MVGFLSAEDFLKSPAVKSVSCALLDLNLSGMDGTGIEGMEVFHRIRELRETLPVVILTGYGSVPLAVEALKAGAHDFIEKPFDPDRLLVALRQATSLEATDREAKLKVATFQEQRAKLTAREREVMEMMIAGHTSKAIGVTLGISVRTVEIYRAHVMAKMKAESLVELIRRTLAVQNCP